MAERRSAVTDGAGRIKVAHLTSVHPAADPRISVKECGALAAAGYDVVLVCAQAGPAVVNGVRVVRVSQRRGRIARMILTTWDVYRAARRERARVYHLHDPELLPIGVLLRFTGRGAAVIYDVHEDVPRQILAKSWIPVPLRRPAALAAALIERAAVPAMAAIVAATPPIARRFPAARTVTVQNFVEPGELVVDPPTPYRRREAAFAYVGAIADVRGGVEMVDAIARVPRALGAQLVLAGLCAEAFRRELEQRPGWRFVSYRGWASRGEVAAQLDRARAGLLLMHPTRNYLDSYPSKAFEYMTAGLPLIVSDFPFWRELFENVGCAIFVDPQNPDSIARAMTWVLEHPEDAERMGALGIAAARDRFNWRAESAKLVDLYARLTHRDAAARARTGDAPGAPPEVHRSPAPG